MTGGSCLDGGAKEVRFIDLNRSKIHRDSERQLHFDSKFEHEEMVLVA